MGVIGAAWVMVKLTAFVLLVYGIAPKTFKNSVKEWINNL